MSRGSLTPEEVVAIRTSRLSLARLALAYNVSRSTIANIKAGRTHKNPGTCPTCGQKLENK